MSDRTAYYHKHYIKYRDKYLKRSLEQSRRLRDKALYIVGRGLLKCLNCGCDDKRFLEINHINGGGCKEYRGNKNNRVLYQNIVRGHRGIDDLNLLCRVCNAVDHLKRRHGEAPFQVIYRI